MATTPQCFGLTQTSPLGMAGGSALNVGGYGLGASSPSGSYSDIEGVNQQARTAEM